MLEKKTKNFIKKELEDLCFDDALEEKIDFFSVVLDYIVFKYGKDEAYDKIADHLNGYVENSNLLDLIIDSSLNIESYLKKLLEILDFKVPNDLINTMFELKLFSEDDRLSDGRIKFNTHSESRHYYSKYFKRSEKKYYYGAAYACRNKTSHSVEQYSMRTKVEFLDGLLLTFIDATWMNKRKIELLIAKNTINPNGYLAFLDAYINKNKSYIKYIPAKSYVQEIKNYIGIEKFLKSRGKHIKLLGQAGIGKTSTIFHLVQKDINTYSSTGKIPVYIQLRDYNSFQNDFEYAIMKKLDISYEICEKYLMLGIIKVYFDGLNEIVTSHNSMRIILTNIDKFITKYNNTFILLSDRENNYTHLMNEGKTFNIAKLDDLQIKDFVFKNCRHEKVDELISYLNNESIREIVRVPFMLVTLIRIFELNGELPSDEIDFSRSLLESIISRELNEKFDSRAKKLDSLFMLICENASEEFTETQMKRSIKSIYKFTNDSEVDDLIALTIQMGLIEKTNGHFCFANNMFYDYYFTKRLMSD